jgi:SAM-dependent methyltransferase
MNGDAREPQSAADAEDRLLHGSSFGAAAVAYAEHRPDYAEAAVRWAIESAPGDRVLDIGAGTGKLTATLVALGADVTAVEPDPAMLAELCRRLPAARALTGNAEAIPLPDASVDAVVAGQALHWFDMAVAGPEIARVLAPGGVLAALWNVDDDRVDWVAGLDQATEMSASVTLTGWRTEAAGAHLTGIDLPGLFGPAQPAEFPHGQRRTAESLLATISTHSRLLVMDEQARTDLLDRVRGYLASRPETSSGEFTLPMMTVVLRAQREPGGPVSPRPASPTCAP